MCLICIEFQRQRMTVAEARRAYGEMLPALELEHAREVLHMLDEVEATGGERAPLPTPPEPDQG